MPQSGREEQTLVYRVELDEASLSDVIRSARDAVGSAMGNAVNAGSDMAGSTHLTAATAIARSTSHLDFLRQSAPGMGQHADNVAGAQGMGMATALGVRAGLVNPRFSETTQSMHYRSRKALGDAMPDSLGVMSAAASAASIVAGVGLMFVPGVGTAAGSAILAGEIGGDMALTTGFDRVRDRKMLEDHLLKLGKPNATAAVRGFEDQVRGMRGISFSEASQVGAAALSNINVSGMSSHAVEQALVGSIGDWRATGKALGLEKEAALATVGSMYRMGIRPGEVSQVVAGSAGAAQSMGMAQPHLVHGAAMQFAAGAQAQGFSAFSSANSFQLQAGSIAEMMRAGVMDRGQLTAAAGFSGPQSDQVIAAAQNMMGETMRMSQTGFGRMVTAGIQGGAQDMSMGALSGAAAGMSTQQMLEFNANIGSMANLGQQQKALGGLARDVITGMGGEVTAAAMTSQLMGMGMSRGAAQVLSQSEMNPNRAGIAQARQHMAATNLYAENRRSTRGGAAMDMMGSKLGDAVEYAHKGGSSMGMMAASSGIGLMYTPHMAVLESMAGPGAEYRGVRGIGDFVGDLFDTTYGEMGRDIREFFDQGGALAAMVSPLGYMLGESDRVAGYAPGTMMTRRELDSMGTGGFRRLMAGVATSDRDFRREMGSDPGANRITFLRKEQGQILRDIQDSSPAARARLSGDVRRLRDVAGVDVGDEGMLKLVGQASRFQSRLKGASEEERGKIQNELANTIEGMGMLEEGTNADAVAGFLLGDTIQTKLTGEQAARAKQLGDREFVESTVLGATKSRAQREELAKKMFGTTTSKAAKEFINADNLSATKFRGLVEKGAGATGEGLTKDFRRSLAKGMDYGNAAMLQLAQDAAQEGADVRREPGEEPEGEEGGTGGGGGLSALVGTLQELVEEIRADRRSRE